MASAKSQSENRQDIVKNSKVFGRGHEEIKVAIICHFINCLLKHPESQGLCAYLRSLLLEQRSQRVCCNSFALYALLIYPVTIASSFYRHLTMTYSTDLSLNLV